MNLVCLLLHICRLIELAQFSLIRITITFDCILLVVIFIHQVSELLCKLAVILLCIYLFNSNKYCQTSIVNITLLSFLKSYLYLWTFFVKTIFFKKVRPVHSIFFVRIVCSWSILWGGRYRSPEQNNWWLKKCIKRLMIGVRSNSLKKPYTYIHQVFVTM